MANDNRKKILIFFSHNPSPPQHGAHLRALQQIGEIRRFARVFLASAEHTSDTQWPVGLAKICEALGVERVCIFERSIFGRSERYVQWLARQLVRVGRRLGWRWLSHDMSHAMRQLFMRLWFAGLVWRNRIDLVVINYTYLSYLVSWLPRGVLRVIELHDLIPVFRHLVERVNDQIVVENGVARLKDNASRITYIACTDQLPSSVQDELRKNVQTLKAFDLVWSISDREQIIINEIDESVPVDTVYPRIFPRGVASRDGKYALIPIGPNVFNLYSLLRFIGEVEPNIRYGVGSEVLITGGSPGNIGFNLPSGVRYLGMVDNYIEKLMSARFVIAPTSVGTGQQLKVFEALTYGVPVVCFRISIPRFLDSMLYGVVSVDDESGFADAVTRMWNDEVFYLSVSNGAIRFRDELSRKEGYRSSVERLSAVRERAT